jgi:hypothetical protein
LETKWHWVCDLRPGLVKCLSYIYMLLLFSFLLFTRGRRNILACTKYEVRGCVVMGLLVALRFIINFHAFCLCGDLIYYLR